MFPGHKVSTLEELKEGGAEEILIQEPSHEACKVHDQPKNMFCYDCDILICRDCTIKDHRDHNYEFVRVAGPEAKEMLNQQLERLRKSQRSLSCAIKEIQTTIAEVEDQGGSVANTIKCLCAELHAIIDNHQESLLTEAATRVQQKVKHLSGQEKSLSTAYASAQSVIEYTEQCLEHSPNDKVVCMRVEMQSRIDREIQEQKEGENLAPVEKVDMGVEVSCAEDLKQLCLTKAKIMQLAIEHAVTGGGVKSAEVSKMSEFRVMTALSNGKPAKQPVVIECHLHSLAKDSTTKCTVDLIQGGEYRVQYTPTVRGRHEVIVTVNGQEVAGSPFPVFVSIHPTQLGKPVQVITVENYPCDVDVTPAGNIIVAGSDKVAIFDKNGKKLKELKGSEFGFGNPYCVAIDSTDGSMYITSKTNIVKLSPDFKQEQVVNTSGSDYRGVKVVGDEVMVCNFYDGVMVYTKELKYVRKIGSHGDGLGQFDGIWGVSSDEHGNLYVSDYRKSCVHVFSNGEFLHSFGCGKDGEKVLLRPRGVCVAGQYVYVANFGKQCVSVFTTKGEHVTTFGQKDSDAGDFDCPRGVCVDKDGFVYVSDSAYKKISVY